MHREVRSQGEQQHARAHVATHSVYRHWSLLFCGIVLVAAWTAQAQAPNSATELARAFEAMLRVKDFDALSKHVAGGPASVKALRTVLEARLAKFSNLPGLRVYTVPADDKAAEDRAAGDMQKRGGRFTPLKTNVDLLKKFGNRWAVEPAGYLVVLDDTQIFTVQYGNSGGRSFITLPETR